MIEDLENLEDWQDWEDWEEWEDSEVNIVKFADKCGAQIDTLEHIYDAYKENNYLDCKPDIDRLVEFWGGMIFSDLH